DPSVRLRDLNTLRKVTAHFVARLEEARDPLPPVPAPSGADQGRIEAMLLESLVAQTGYPPDMLEPDLDLEADLGVDTVKQLAVFASVRERLGLAQDPSVRLRDF